MRRLIVSCLTVMLVAGCSAGSASGPSGNSPQAPAVTAHKGSGAQPPKKEEPYSASPTDPAVIERMLRAQGFRNPHKRGDGNAVDFDDPACPQGLAGNLGGVHDGRLHLLITHDGIDFLDVDKPPTRQQLDEYGICPLRDLS